MAAQPSVAGASGTSTAVGGMTHLLEFEKPIAKMEQEIQRLEASQAETGRDYTEVISNIRQQLDAALRQAYANLTPWENVLVARHPRRPLLRDYIRMIAQDFCELHGDRLYGDDLAMVCGFGRIDKQKVMIIGQHKGRDTRERVEVNFGCAHPEGYRKALRCMELAAKFKVPVVALIDTAGAYPGVESEERGIATAIAVNLMRMATLETPLIACVIGEGGSGGALGIAVADHVAVMQYAYYSVISPEGGAAILWKSGEHAPKAAAALRMTPKDLVKLGLVDTIISEPLGGAHRDPTVAAKNLEAWVGSTLRELKRLKPETLLKRRYERVRGWGAFVRSAETPATNTKPTRSRSRKVATA